MSTEQQAFSILSINITNSNKDLIYLYEIIKSCFGPNAKIKLIHNLIGGKPILTSSSKILLENICISKPLFNFILNPVKQYVSTNYDGGLFLANLILSTLHELSQLELNRPTIQRKWILTSTLCLDILQKNDFKGVCQINYDNIDQLLAVISSVICSKPACGLSKTELFKLNLLIAKAFINSLESNFMSNIHIVENYDLPFKHTQLFEGVLINHNKDISFSKHLKIIVYSKSLIGTSIDLENVVENQLFYGKLVDHLISLKVELLACQQVVHPILKQDLERHNIIVIERLGHRATQQLVVLSLATKLDVEIFPQECDTGLITSISQVEILHQKFLSINNTNVKVNTILLCNRNPTALSETYLVCNQALQTLSKMARMPQPKAYYGAGCLEAILVEELLVDIDNAVTKALIRALKTISSQIMRESDCLCGHKGGKVLFMDLECIKLNAFKVGFEMVSLLLQTAHFEY